ncbi:MAG: PAC2 family protein [Candidatus Diapherotrites archaeon]
MTAIKILSKKKCKNAVLFSGLPGIGLVGKIAIDHLVSQLKAEKVAEVWSDSFPPSVRSQNSIVELIKDEIFYAKVNKRNCFFLAGPVQPALDFQSPFGAEHYEFAASIVSFCKQAGISELYCLAGIDVRNKRLEKEPSIVIAATSKKFLDSFKGQKNVVFNSEEGLISGAAGMILGIGKENGLQGACLMGETNAQLFYGDHGAAKKLLELLVQRFKFKVSLDAVEKEAKKVQQAFENLNKQLKSQQELDNEKPSYVR